MLKDIDGFFVMLVSYGIIYSAYRFSFDYELYQLRTKKIFQIGFRVKRVVFNTNMSQTDLLSAIPHFFEEKRFLIVKHSNRILFTPIRNINFPYWGKIDFTNHNEVSVVFYLPLQFILFIIQLFPPLILFFTPFTHYDMDATLYIFFFILIVFLAQGHFWRQRLIEIRRFSSKLVRSIKSLSRDARTSSQT